MKTFVFLAFLGGLGLLAASRPPRLQTAPTYSSLLSRHYRADQKLSYIMNGANNGWRYQIQADGVVKQNPDGTYIEEYAWSNLISNGARDALPAASRAFRQVVSLDLRERNEIPNLRNIAPVLIGPITDFLTFYADDWLAIRSGKLNRAGDHFYVKYGSPVSWADDRRIVLGQSSIDFDLVLVAVNKKRQTATLLVRHIPPPQSQIRIPAAWMRLPVAGTPNNWVQVEKTGAGGYKAAVGKETFDVRIQISLKDGRILSGMLDNTVHGSQRGCTDAALLHCGQRSPLRIHRRIEITAKA